MDELERSVILSATAVGTVVAIAVRLVQLIIARARGRAFGYATGWRATTWWALGFGGVALAVIGMWSIGIIVLPFALGACGFAAWRGRAMPEAAIGAALGTGALCLFIVLINLGYRPCGVGPVRVPAGVSYHCGGMNGAPWLPPAIVLVIAGVIGEVILQRNFGVGGPRSTGPA